MPSADDLIDGLMSAGSYLRYGMSPVDKYKHLLESPEYKNATDEAGRTEAERANSVRLASSNLSALGPLAANGLPIAANFIREGSQGLGALAAGKPFFTPGGFQSSDQTVSDEDPAGGFNLRTMATAASNTPAGQFITALLKR